MLPFFYRPGGDNTGGSGPCRKTFGVFPRHWKTLKFNLIFGGFRF